MKKLIIAAAFTLAATPALAQECNQATAEGLSQELATAVESKGATDEQLEQYVTEVEAHYGGEPSDAQICEALQMLIDKVESGS